MKKTVENLLEFSTLRDILAGYTETAGGLAKARRLEPSTEPEVVSESLADTTEARRLRDENESLSLAELPDLSATLEALRIRGRALEPEELSAIARFAAATRRARDHFTRRKDRAPRLAALAGSLPSLEDLDARIRRVLDVDAHEVRDDASSALFRMRARSRKLEARIERLLASAVANRDRANLLQEPLVTTRNDRPVVPVKAEAKGRFPGIVHGSSASGATIFVEPLAAVEPGNELAALRDREREEIRRILLELTDSVRERHGDLETASEIASELDMAQAKARLSEAYRGQEPRLGGGGELSLRDARHPLLVPGVAERAGFPRPDRDPVPLSLRLDDARRALVLTGPNTGGKTVALKTAGLLCLMAQAGLHVPAASASVVPVCRSVFADIGDDQSIGASLSTFSAHLARVVEMERELELPALVILDEVGTGTDPAEGGALGCALVEHFLSRGAFVLASTHHGLLKAYAATTDGVGAASFDFDPRTYAPTFRLLDGASGRSLAFEMAERLGLPRSIVSRARALQSERDRQVGELAARLESESERLVEERRRVESQKRALDEERALGEEREKRARRERSRELASFRASLEEELQKTRHELRQLVEEARRTAAHLEGRGVKELERRIAKKMDEIAAPLLEAATAKKQRAGEADAAPPLVPGARVLVASFGMEGEVVSLGEAHADVLVHDKRVRLPLEQLELLSPPSPAREPPPTSGGATTPAGKTVPGELNVVGCTVEEAIDRADKFLDDAFLSDRRHVRLIHGHGTGRLKNALAEWLADHPQVARLESENRGGVTVVELKD